MPFVRKIMTDTNDKREKFEKNSILRVRIDDMNNLGSGVGRIGGMVVFVPGACTGELLDVKLIKIAKSYLVGRTERIVEPSPYRVKADCPASKRCGGCVYRNVSYQYELDCKRRTVEACMRKNGLDVEVLPPIYGEPDRYRNKAQYPVGRAKDGSIAIGFYAGKTHEIIDVREGCRLQPEIFGKIADHFRDYLTAHKIQPYDELTGKGTVRHLYLRRSESTGRVMVCVVLTGRADWMSGFASGLRDAIPEVSCVYANINADITNVVLGEEYIHISGEEKLTDRLCGREFSFSPASFWQVNRPMAEKLYKVAGELADIRPGERVLDLFCGIGTVGMSICPPETRLTGIEIVQAAVDNAKENAEKNSFTNADFICVDASDPTAVERELARLESDGGIDLIFLDPPRKGCSPELLRLISERTDARIVYISCGPDTLARDMALLRGLGYQSSAVRTVDLFPRTGHIESVVLLSKG